MNNNVIYKKILKILEMRIQIENLKISINDVKEQLNEKIKDFDDNISIKEINKILDDILLNNDNRLNKFKEKNNEERKIIKSTDKLIIINSFDNKNIIKESKIENRNNSTNKMKFNSFEKNNKSSIKFYKETKNFSKKKIVNELIDNIKDDRKKNEEKKKKKLKQILNNINTNDYIQEL